MGCDIEDTIIKCQRGDAKAFSYIFDEFHISVFSLALKMLNDIGDAEDIVQEVFVKVWDSIKSYSSEKSRFSTWLYTITSRSCLDQLRKRKNIFTVTKEQIEEFRNMTESDADPLEDNDAVNLIKALSATLTPTQKLVFVLRDLEGYDVKEVIGITKLTEKQIKDNLYLARKSIKKKMEKLF